MNLYIDTANISEIRELAWLIDGVTTNPSLVAKEKRPFKEVVREICEIVDGPVSAEATALDADKMIEQGRDLAKIHENVVIKIPMTEEGMKAVKALTQDGIRTNVTLVFSIVASVRHPQHVLDAALLGAEIATVPYAILKKLFNHPLTDVGIERFLKDWEGVPK
jgi:transaldolase